MSNPPKVRSMNRVGVYLRVSTEDQTMASQKHAIDEFLEQKKGDEQFRDIRWYEDKGYSGAYNKRPAYLKMLADAEAGRISMVVVYKMDRLTRDARTAIWTILRLDEMGCQFVSVSQPMFSHGTPFRHAMIAIFAELAQMERETIVERINTGIAAAKKRGVKFGRPKKLTTAKEEKIVKLRRDERMSFAKISKEVKLSVGVVHGFIKKVGDPLSSGTQG